MKHKVADPARQARIEQHRREWRERMDAKRDGVTERAEARALRSCQQQLQYLDSRLGPGVGAKKERARLAGGD